MIFPEDVETAIVRAIGKLNFGSENCLNPQQRAASAEEAMRSLAKFILTGGGKLVDYVCGGCKCVERLHAASNNPMHRHGKALYMLHKKENK